MTFKFYLIICLFLALILLLVAQKTPYLSTYSQAFAKITTVTASEEKWARIENENTPFYADYGCTMVKFYLPYTYFIKVISTGEDATRVVYMDDSLVLPLREGYVKTCDIYLFDGTPPNPYPEMSIKITADEILFADSKKQYPKTVLTYGDSATYYGELPIDGEIFCYVYCNGYIGYVRKSAFTPFELPPHELPLRSEELPAEGETNSSLPVDSLTPQTPAPVTTVDSTMRVVIIVAIALVCISVIYLLFRPAPARTKLATWQDEEDF